MYNVLRIAITLLVAGCAGSPVRSTGGGGTGENSAVGTGGSSGNPGRLEKRIMSVASSSSTAQQMVIRVDDSGAVTKLALRHADAQLVPRPVVQLAESKFPGAKLDAYELESYADAPVVHHVVVQTADGKRCEVSAFPDGKERYVECQVEQGALPEPVIKTVRDAVPGANIVGAKKKTTASGTEFQIETKNDRKQFFFRVQPDGELIGRAVRIPAVVELPLPPAKRASIKSW